jgi:cytoskeletal protein RodZ
MVLGILGAVAAVVLIAALVLVYFFVIKDDDKSTTSASSSSSQTKSKSSSTRTSTPAASGAEVTDGDLAITFSRTDTGDTITSSISDSLEVTAKGMYLVVYFNVTNNGTSSSTLLLAQQKLNAGGQTYDADPEANFYLSGAATVDIQPGATEEVGVVFDVPVDTEPESLQVFGSVTSSGVELPLS